MFDDNKFILFMRLVFDVLVVNSIKKKKERKKKKEEERRRKKKEIEEKEEKGKTISLDCQPLDGLN